MSEAQAACPLCGADLRAEEIPESSRQYYGAATHFSRAILVEVRGEYDGGLFWHCPDCGGDYDRWPEGHPLWKVARKHMKTFRRAA